MRKNQKNNSRLINDFEKIDPHKMEDLKNQLVEQYFKVSEYKQICYCFHEFTIEEDRITLLEFWYLTNEPNDDDNIHILEFFIDVPIIEVLKD
jgi:hypothetical protein